MPQLKIPQVVLSYKHCGRFPLNSFQINVIEVWKNQNNSWKVWEIPCLLHINHTGIYEIRFCIVDKFHQRAFSVKYGRKTDKIHDISTSCSPPGWRRVSKKRERPTEFEFLGFRCDHEVLRALEAKNRSKTGVFDEIWLFLSGFWLLALLKLHGRP